jgi:hypothetical protein
MSIPPADRVALFEHCEALLQQAYQAQKANDEPTYHRLLAEAKALAPTYPKLHWLEAKETGELATLQGTLKVLERLVFNTDDGLPAYVGQLARFITAWYAPSAWGLRKLTIAEKHSRKAGLHKQDWATYRSVCLHGAQLAAHTAHIEAFVDFCTKGKLLALPEVATYEFSPAMQAVAHQLGLLNTPFAQYCSQWLQQPETQQLQLEAVMADTSISVAVVGNAPVLLGQGQGSVIDAHDKVVRFNNFKCNAQLVTDVGRKLTYWVKVPHFSDGYRSPYTGVEALITGDRRFALYPSEALLTRYQGLANCYVPQRLWYALCHYFNALPSNGMLMLYWLKAVRGHASQGNWQAYGFELKNHANQADRHYFDDDLPRLKPGSHHWDKERAFYETYLLTDTPLPEGL